MEIFKLLKYPAVKTWRLVKGKSTLPRAEPLEEIAILGVGTSLVYTREADQVSVVQYNFILRRKRTSFVLLFFCWKWLRKLS